MFDPHLLQLKKLTCNFYFIFMYRWAKLNSDNISLVWFGSLVHHHDLLRHLHLLKKRNRRRHRMVNTLHKSINMIVVNFVDIYYLFCNQHHHQHHRHYVHVICHPNPNHMSETIGMMTQNGFQEWGGLRALRWAIGWIFVTLWMTCTRITILIYVV